MVINEQRRKARNKDLQQKTKLHIPVITIDGPAASGKGTASQLLAKKLSWHLLDSGALYRVLAFAIHQQSVDVADQQALAQLIPTLKVEFQTEDPTEPPRIILNNQDVTDEVRTESIGIIASKMATLPHVRSVLIDWQRTFRKPPGLVTDGRDMGTTIFPDATLKIYLTASRETRAKRRFKQLMNSGIDVRLRDLIDDLIERDTRDQARKLSPLRKAADAIVIDTTQLSIDEVVSRLAEMARKRLS